MVLSTDYFNSNWFNAKDFDNGLVVEATIVSAGPHTFAQSGDTALTIRTDYMGKGVVLNKARNVALTTAYGPNTDNWIGKQIRLFQGDTLYQGKPEKCVVVDPILQDRIASPAPAKPAAIEQKAGQPKQGSVEVNDVKVNTANQRPFSPITDLDDEIPWE
jgi:hypothetical protein